MLAKSDSGAMRETPPWGLRDVGVVIVLSLGLPIVLGIPVGIIVASDIVEKGRGQTSALLVSQLIFNCILFALVARFSILKYHRNWQQLGFRQPAVSGGWWLPLAVVITMYAIVGVYIGIIQVLGFDQAIPKSTLPEDVNNDSLLLALIGALAIFSAPIVEETFFRGFLFPALRKRWGFIVAAAISGFLFALAHADPGSIIPFTIIGMVLAGVYAYTGSLWISIASHFLFNFVSFVALISVGGTG